jgi:hypothetical protein
MDFLWLHPHHYGGMQTSDKPKINSAQIRGARALLNWSALRG